MQKHIEALESKLERIREAIASLAKQIKYHEERIDVLENDIFDLEDQELAIHYEIEAIKEDADEAKK